MASSLPGDLSSIATSLINSIITANAYKKYAKKLEGMQMTLPQEYNVAQGMLETQANVGLPGYETQKQNIEASVPTTINQMRDYMDSSNIPSLLSRIYSQSQGQMQQLNMAQEGAISANKQSLAQYLYGVKAPAQTSIDQYNNELKAAAERARMSAKGAALQGATSAVGTATDTSLITSVIGGVLGTDLSSQIATTAPQGSYLEPQAGGDEMSSSSVGGALDYIAGSQQQQQPQQTSSGGSSGIDTGGILSLLMKLI